MARELKGSRYLTKENEPLAEAILTQLPYMDFFQTLRFYAAIDAGLDDKGRALLNANDRYYLLTVTCHRKDAWKPWIFDRCREVERSPDGHLDLWARYHYKNLCIKTKILTTSGWTTHGALKPGDYVFGADGRPTKVLATRHFTDGACRRVTFDNGISIICGSGHLWTIDLPSRERVRGTKNGRKARKSVTLETDAIAALQALYRPIIKATQPLEYPIADLPIDPYVLGAWLGDGYSGQGAICGMDHEVFDHIRAAGYVLTDRRLDERKHKDFRVHGIRGFERKLKDLGVFGNKHIPDQYLMASKEQRLALLQGLIDTDGSASPDNGCITFAQTDKRMAEQVQFLAIGLGFKARLSPVRAGAGSWHVVFQASYDDRPCRVTRKLDALRQRQRRPGSRGWRIHSIEAVETTETNCIQVEASDGLYLAGEHLIPTHNSTVGTFAGCLQEIIIDPEITIAIMSGTNKIALPFLIQLQEEMESNEDLRRIHHDVFWDEPRKQAPQWSREKGITVRRKSNPKEATVEAFGLIDGMRTGKHYKILIYDDLIDETMVDNPDIIRKVTQRWELSDNLGQLSGTRKQHFGTRYSFADTYGILIERKTLKERRHPATEDGQLKGKPVLLTPERWEEVKNAQRSTVNAQMLLNPLAGNESTFQTASLKHYDIIPAILNVYILVDPSKGKTKRSDRTAIAVIGIDVAGNKYLLDGYCHRMKLSRRYELITQLKEKWENHPGVQILRVGYEQYGMQSDLETIEENQLRDDNYFEIVELNTPQQGKHSKNDRIERLEPDIRAGRFYLPHVVYHPEYGGGISNQALWEVWTKEDFDRMQEAGAKDNPEVGKILYRPMKDLTKIQRAMELTSQGYRIVTAIKRRNEDGDIYDLTRELIEELRFHPFAPHDDLSDAASRIYDIEPASPVAFEGLATEGRTFPDS